MNMNKKQLFRRRRAKAIARAHRHIFFWAIFAAIFCLSFNVFINGACFDRCWPEQSAE